MKKLFFAFMAVATIAMIGCKKEEPTKPSSDPSDDQTQVPPTSEDVPEGYVKILIQVPDGEECHGIYMKGSLDGSQWSGADTYIGLDDPASAPENAIKFERVEDNSDFFAALFKLGSDGLQGAVCQKYPDDGSWQGKSRKVKLIEEKTTLEGAKDLSLPQFHIPAGTKSGVLALKIGGWENSECVNPNPAGTAIWTMKTTVALPEGTVVGITGTNLDGKGNWQHESPIIMTKQPDGSYTAINGVQANCVYKYVLKLPGEPGFADHHGHIVDGFTDNLVMPESLEPVDVVEGWKELDTIYAGEPLDKETVFYSLIGTAVGGWETDVDLVYGTDEGDVYVATASNVAMQEGEFKVRVSHGWDVNYGWGSVEIAGDPENFQEGAGGNIACKAAKTYSTVTFKFKWNGEQAIERQLIFTE